MEPEIKFSYKIIHDYIINKEYPSSFSKDDKRALRKRAEFFKAQDGQLYYVGSGSSKFTIHNSSTIISSKVFICNQRSFAFISEIKGGHDVCRLVVEDKEQRERIVSSIQDPCHLGVNRTVDMIAPKYYWPGLTTDVKQYVSL